MGTTMKKQTQYEIDSLEALSEKVICLTGEVDAIAELNHAQYLALENIRLFAVRFQKEAWAQHMLGFCEDAALKGNAIHLAHASHYAGLPAGFFDALRRQKQIDEDGEEVGVSRQAVDTAIEFIESWTRIDHQKTAEINILVKENRALAVKTEQTEVLCATVNQLLHQLDIGEFLDEHGHNAKMLKPTHDLMMILSGDKFQLAGLLEEHEEKVWNSAIDHAIDQYRAEYLDDNGFARDPLTGTVIQSLARLKK